MREGAAKIHPHIEIFFSNDFAIYYFLKDTLINCKKHLSSGRISEKSKIRTKRILLLVR